MRRSAAAVSGWLTASQRLQQDAGIRQDVRQVQHHRLGECGPGVRLLVLRAYRLLMPAPLQNSSSRTRPNTIRDGAMECSLYFGPGYYSGDLCIIQWMEKYRNGDRYTARQQQTKTETRAKVETKQHTEGAVLDLVHDAVAQHELVLVRHALEDQVRLRGAEQRVVREALVDGLQEVRDVHLLVVLVRARPELGQARAEEVVPAEPIERSASKFPKRLNEQKREERKRRHNKSPCSRHGCDRNAGASEPRMNCEGGQRLARQGQG